MPLLSLAVLGADLGSGLVCGVCGVLGPVALMNSNARLTGCDGVTTNVGASDNAAGVADLLLLDCLLLFVPSGVTTTVGALTESAGVCFSSASA